MKQVVQSLRTGITEVIEVPYPAPKENSLVIRSAKTLVSAGTERMLVEFGKAGWLDKARQQPDKVRAVIEKMKTDGLLPTIEAVLAKLDRPLPLGYCNVGRVLEVGSRTTGFAVGDRVMSNGHHAEVVSVPARLCAKVPSNVSDEEAAFAVLAAIALQGIRLASPTLGETVAVSGLGLIGLLTVQLLKANGCRVIGLDMHPARLALAKQFGAETVDISAGVDPIAAATLFSRGRGVDASLITASTSSSEPVHQAAQMCRKRGRIVLVGVTGLELARADFYEKELTFQVSCSYGPGRHDVTYEQQGVDYPIGFVRWTEQRNFEAVLDMMADGRLDVRPLISHRFAIDEAPEAYELITSGEPSLGILLDYSSNASALPHESSPRSVAVPVFNPQRAATSFRPRIACIGAGNYASGILLPAFQVSGAELMVMATQSGVSSVTAARSHGFREATTDLSRVFDNPDVDAVVIATRHDSHAALVARAIDAGKHVFVEKPLAMNEEGIMAVKEAHSRAADRGGSPLVTVGFNRRFSPHILKIKALLAGVTAPKAFVMTVNAGALPGDHWAHDCVVGGGRLIGEACHFIDLCRHLAGSPIVAHSTCSMEPRPHAKDSATLTMRFADGSIGTIHYLCNGSRLFPKERLEIFANGAVLQLDNFRRLRGFGWPGFSSMNLWRQDKGHRACAKAFITAVASGEAPPIPFEELLEVAELTIAMAE